MLRLKSPGTYVLSKVAVAEEISSREAARILGCSGGTILNILKRFDPDQIIKWRWVNTAGGKRLFDSESILTWLDSRRGIE